MTESVVKSAARVLEVFEYFASRRMAASVSEVCLALSYPQSSTSVLLKSLFTLGYLTYDSATRRYSPTQRVALLGGWLRDTANGLPALLEQLHKATGATVLLAQQNGIEVQYIQVLAGLHQAGLHQAGLHQAGLHQAGLHQAGLHQAGLHQAGLHQAGPHDARQPVAVGTCRPMTLTATGRVLLARMSDAHVLRIARHANAQAADERARVDEGELLAAIHAIRHSGFAFTDGHMTPGAGVIATLAPDIAGQPPLAIGLGGTSERIRRDRDALVATMRRLIPGAAAEPAEAPAAAGFAPDAGEWVNGPLSARAA